MRLGHRFLILLVAVFGLAFLGWTGYQAKAALPNVQSRSADQFVDSIGVVTHIDLAPYTDPAVFENGIKPMLAAIDIRHIREHLPLAGEFGVGNENFIPYSTKFKELSDVGKDFIFITDTTNSHDPNNRLIDDIIRVMRYGGVLNTKVFGGGVSFDGIEGPNEYDHCPSSVAGCEGADPWQQEIIGYHGADWYSKLATHMSGLYGAVKNDSSINDIAVIAPSLSHLNTYSNFTTLEGENLLAYMARKLPPNSDNGNVHPYCYDQYDCTGTFIQSWQSLFTGKEMYLTETGYPTNPAGDWHVTEDQQNSFLIRDLINFYDLGNVKRVFAFDFWDRGVGGSPNQFREGSFGIVNQDGSPKKIYNTLKNTLSLLGEPGGNPNPGTLQYSVEGGTFVKHSLLQKKDGRFYVLLRIDDMDRSNAQGYLTGQLETATLNLETEHKVELYLPSDSATPIATYNSTNRVNLEVPDTLLIAVISDPVSGSGWTGGGNLPPGIPTTVFCTSD